MLLDTIKRHDGTSLMKLVSIEGLRHSGYKIPSKIHSVPAIVFDNANVIFGKQVFDYLLLPGRGLLLTQQPKADASVTNNVSGTGDLNSGPAAFTLGSLHSDSFSVLEGSDHHTDKNYAWTSIFENPASDTGAQAVAYQEETRTKKELPDLNSIREQRQLDLQRHQENHINIPALTPPTSTRV